MRGIATVPVDGLEAVPPFRPEQVDVPPPAVAAFRATLEACDGVLLAAPEYAGGVSGVTKNALDWCVGSGSLYRRPIAVLSAGTTGGPFAIAQLVRTLSWHGAHVVATLGIEGQRTKRDATGAFTHPGTLAAIAAWAGRLADAVAAPEAERLARVADTVAPIGIDPARFGGGTG